MGASSEVEDGNLDNYIYFLRRRLRTLNAPVKITTVHGVGYRLEKLIKQVRTLPERPADRGGLGI